MENVIIKNCQTTEAKLQGQGSSQCLIRPIIDNVTNCAANFMELEPGSYTYFRYQANNETVFYIIGEQAIFRTENGDVDVFPGDSVYLSNNVKGSLVIHNPSKTDTLLYLEVTAISKSAGSDDTAVKIAPRSGFFKFKK